MNKRVLTFWLCWALSAAAICIGLQAHAQSSSATMGHMLKYLSINEGLSQNNVSSLLRDSRGMLWVGTHYGLNRYDNDRIFTYFHEGDSTSIPDNEINLLWEDHKGNVWVAAKRGVARYDHIKDKFTPMRLPDGSDVNARSVLLQDDGMILGGAGNLYRYDDASGKIDKLPTHGGSKRFYTAILPWTMDEWILATRWDGLWVYNPKTRTVQRAEFSPEQHISAAALDHNGNLWISVYGEGVECFDRYGHSIFKTKLRDHDMTSDIVLDIMDAGDNMLFATDGSGVVVLNKKTHAINRMRRDPSQRTTNSINTLHRDQCGNLYAGSVREGAIMVYPTTMRTYTTDAATLTDLVVTDIIQHGPRRYYGADGAGVLMYDHKNDTFQSIPSTFGMKVTNLVPYDDNTLLVSTFDEGMYLLDINTYKLSPAPAMLQQIVKENEKKALAMETWALPGRKLAVLTDQVYIYDLNNNTYKTLKVNLNGVSFGHLLPLSSDSTSMLIIAQNAILQLDLNSQKITPKYILEPDAVIKDATRDAAGNLYLTTGDKIAHCDARTGEINYLSDVPRNINTLISDGEYLWIGANNTLYRRHKGTGRTQAFNQYDGVRPNEFTGRAVYVDGQAVMIGGINGMLVIDKNVNGVIGSQNEANQAIFLTQVDVDGEPKYEQLHDNTLTISPSHTTISLKVIELESNLMRDKMFRFLIQGHGQSITIDTYDRTLQLGSLAAGNKYKVYASCSTVDGGWTQPQEIIEIIVRAHWWNTWWAWCIYAIIAIAGLSTGIYMRRQRDMKIKQRKEKHILEKEVGFLVNINYELRTPLSLIYGPLKMLRKKLSDQKLDQDSLDEMGKIMEQVDRMRDVINMSLETWRTQAVKAEAKMERHSLNKLVGMVANEYRNSAKIKSQNFVFNLEKDLEDSWFDIGRMTIVLNNIFLNAIDIADEGASISVITKNDAEHNAKILHVSHAAPGMKEGDVQELFKNYQPEDSNRFGTGLGFAYAKILVDMQKGKMRAWLEEGILNVEVTIPDTPEPEAEKAESPSVPKAAEVAPQDVDTIQTSELTAVIVEPDPDLLSFITKEFQYRFKSVITCANPSEALIKVRNAEPDLVVSANIDLCRQIKNNPTLKHIPVVLLSMPSDEQKAYNAGADRFVGKPFDMSVLMHRCLSLLSTRTMLKERYKTEGAQVIPDQSTNNSDETFVRKINEIIQSNLQNPDFSVDMIVSQLFMSRSAVYMRFKEVTGRSLGSYVAEYKLNKAKNMLEDQSIPINEISDSLGFNSQRYFSTFFKQKTGMSPSQWRSRQAAPEAEPNQDKS